MNCQAVFLEKKKKKEKNHTFNVGSLLTNSADDKLFIFCFSFLENRV